MDSIVRFDLNRHLVIKDRKWKETTAASFRSSPDWIMSALRNREKGTGAALGSDLKLDESLLDNDEMMDLMSKVTGTTSSVPEALKWKDNGLKELITKSRPHSEELEHRAQRAGPLCNG